MNRILIATFLLQAVVCSLPGFASDEAEHAVYSPEVARMSSLIDASKYTEVLEQGPPLLERLRRTNPEGSVDEAKVLDFLVNASYRSRQVMNPEAVEWAQRAIALKERLLGPGSPELANSLMHLGNLYTNRYEGESAIPVYDRAISILEAAGPEHDQHRAVLLSSLGVAYRKTANNPEAMKRFEQARKIQERVLGPNHPDLASTLNNQATVLSEWGDYTAAANLHRRALAIREANFGPDHEWVGESANNLANQLGYLGLYNEALEFQERAVRIFAKQLGLDHPRYWFARMNLGINYQEMGSYADADRILREVIEGLTRIYGATHPQLCFVLDSLAQNEHTQGREKSALDLYTRSLDIGEAAYGKGAYEIADTIGQLGKVLVSLGRLDEAIEKLQRSLAIYRENAGGENALLCSQLNELAKVELLQGDFQRAFEVAAHSRDLCVRDLGVDHPLHAEALRLLARADRGRGLREPALDAALQAEGISRRHLIRTMAVLSEQRALNYAESRVEGLDIALSLLHDHETGPRVERVWDAVIRSRASVLDQFAERNRLLSGESDPATAALQDTSRVLRERLANLTLRGPGWEELDVYRDLLEDLDTQIKDTERRISMHAASDHAGEARSRSGYAETAASLPDGSVLVAYLRGADESGTEVYRAFLLSGVDQEPHYIELGSASTIDEAVAAWREQIAFGVRVVKDTRGFVQVPRDERELRESYTAAGDRLRRLVWDPVATLWNDPETVFLVCDGSLHLVSFASLPVDDERYLLDEDPVLHTLTTERSLVPYAAESRPSTRLLAVGGADYGEGSSVATTRSFEFSSLPHSEIEVEQVRRIWEENEGRAEILTGAGATEKALKGRLAGVSVLHLATHGFFLPSAPGNPLTRSGLALAGANQWQESTGGGNDGILTAQEVSALDLQGMQWAVLSACDTGIGELSDSGEGVFGLRRAFTLAGARTVISSLWPVNDEAASQWMKELYLQHWRRGVTTAEAVRAASRKVLDERRSHGKSDHPYYWAGFLATGQWR